MSEKETRSVLSLLNPRCVPGLLRFELSQTILLMIFQEILSGINSQCPGAVEYWDFFFLSFFFFQKKKKTGFFLACLFESENFISFISSLLAPNLFLHQRLQEGRFKEQLTFRSRLHLHCVSDGSCHFCQYCGKPLATGRCVCCCKLIQIS